MQQMAKTGTCLQTLSRWSADLAHVMKFSDIWT